MSIYVRPFVILLLNRTTGSAFLSVAKSVGRIVGQNALEVANDASSGGLCDVSCT